MLKSIVFTVFQTLRRQGISSWRCYKTSVFCWAPGGGPGQDCLAGVRLSGVSLSGRRPRASPCPCRRPSVGNRRTDSVSTDVPVIYGVFCLRCLKKKTSFFLRCFGPFGGKGFHLGDVTKHRFLRGFGLQEGARGGKIGMLRSFHHRWPKHGPNIAPKMAQHGPT